VRQQLGGARLHHTHHGPQRGRLGLRAGNGKHGAEGRGDAGQKGYAKQTRIVW
jgi:hypothetical protein